MAIDESGERTGQYEPPVAALAERVAGAVITPEQPEYDEARTVWNGLVDRRPAAIVRCTGTADVVACVDFAREEHLPLSVRGGGHNVAGTAVCDDGIVVDLSELRGVHVDPNRRRVRVAGGATWADVDREAQQFGLAVPGGVVSDTGVAGLTLGGGFGHLRRTYGLSCDALRSVDLVTANGDALTASADEHEDLFWALRGGGGNFGVVTSFEFEAYPLGPDVAGCLVFHPAARATEAFQFLREYAADAPEEVSPLAFTATVPDEPEFPETARGEPVVGFFACYAGEDLETGLNVLAPLREFDTPVLDFSGIMPYTEFQRVLDEDYPDGRRYYWKSTYLTGLSDAAIDAIVAASETAPSPLSTVDVWQLGGAIADVDEGETAFGERDAPYMLGIEANWDDAEGDDANIAWARELYETMQEFSPGGLYVNFPGFGEEGEELVRAVYGDNYDRLQQVKARYDPDNLFRANQNITPAPSA
ncbi:FAD/FMN-containing dehydrogenase [Halogranum gelatinilyticum]|uniref:FAD/FMN-containing dehydrogenase n=1 Tax=Halogranum gelatinilyticum TaxID=660521 RepID=A0A1G9XL11_9EURY|nr:FAD-binding oxidoreductase [Halogranum gelatinilyticum]SDM97539.1 FAD/FMN-containing dehydrogenase [Halogranum gelatinilyticum]